MSSNHSQKTIFNSPILVYFFNKIAKFCCFVCRWEVVEKEKPLLKKYVILFGTHTSNWDFFYMMLAVFFYKLPLSWVGKKSLFQSRFGFFFRWLGGLSVDELKANGAVNACAKYFENVDECYIGIAPKGTRKIGAEWKTGFYYIAKAANVPIACAVIDYAQRRSGITHLFYPTDNALEDIEKLKFIYSGYDMHH